MIIPSRRAFFLGAAAILAAPAIARASSLMPISVLRPPKLWGDGIHDDTAALQWLIDEGVRTETTIAFPEKKIYRITDTLRADLGDKCDILVANSTFVQGQKVDPALRVNTARYGEIRNCTFTSEEHYISHVNTPTWRPSARMS